MYIYIYINIMSDIKYTFNEHNKKDYRALYNRIKTSDLYNEEINYNNYIEKIDYKKLMSYVKKIRFINFKN